MPDTDNEFTLDAIEEPAIVHEALVDQPQVLMQRDPSKAKGRGVVRALVPAAEVANYEAAGWYKY